MLGLWVRCVGDEAEDAQGLFMWSSPASQSYALIENMDVGSVERSTFIDSQGVQLFLLVICLGSLNGKKLR